MTRDYFIKITSKIDQTEEDEFHWKYNSPECMWDNFLHKELLELLDFIRRNYTKLGGTFVRYNDHRIICSNQTILEEYVAYKMLHGSTP